MGSREDRQIIPEDGRCWYCGTIVLSASGSGDPKHSVFCCIECEESWDQIINDMNKKFQEWDD